MQKSSTENLEDFEKEDLTPEDAPEQPEEGREQLEKVEMNVDTVADLIKFLKLSYDIAEDPGDKQEIGHQIVKIEMGLANSKDRPENIYVEDMEDNVWGKFYPKLRKIALSKSLLTGGKATKEDIAHTEAHEEIHKYKKVHDEGMTEVIVNKERKPIMRFYVSEQDKVKSTFYKMGMNKAIELYDIDDPEELVDHYIDVEIKEGLVIEKEIKQQLDKIIRNVKKALPELYKRIENRLEGYKKKKVKEILEKNKLSKAA